MNNHAANLMSMFPPYIPNRNAWLLFKVGSLERLRAMQHGLLYMNSLAYFAKLESEASESLRGDSLEPILGRIYGGLVGKYFIKFMLRVGGGDKARVFDVSNKTVLSVEVPNPANIMIFCFSAFADDRTGKIPGESNRELRLDKRLLGFGNHMLLIRDP